MKFKSLLLGLLAFIFFQTPCLDAQNHAISYQGGSRFGDRVLGYCQARYLSYVTGIPFLYRSFPYSQHLTIEYQAENYDTWARRYPTTFTICSANTLTEFFAKIRDPKTPPTLFIVDYFPGDLDEWKIDKTRSIALEIPWDDLAFKSYLQRSLAPRLSIPDFRQPGCLNVAVHVRTMSGPDTPETSLAYFPLKFPTLDYHIRQIRRVYTWNLERPMHVFIFSDSKQPLNLVEEFRSAFQGKAITFDIQVLEKPDLTHVVQDFFAMQKFDVLIATRSNFSLMAGRLASLDMFIYPTHAKGRFPKPTRVDRIQLITRASSWFPYTLNAVLKDE
jgi:hypothetical protein